MGERVTDTIAVAAPMDVVWDTITDLEDYPQWLEGVLETEIVDTTEEGYPLVASFRVDAKVTEVRYTLRYRYQDHDVHWQLVEGDTISQLDGSYELAEDGDGTRVRYSLEVDVDLPLPGFLKKRAAKQILEQGLEGLKDRAEASG